MINRSKLLVLCAFVAGCGGQRLSGVDAGHDAGEQLTECGSDLDCPLGKQCTLGKCTTPTIDDAGNHNACMKDDDCRNGQQCLKSTGDCIQVKPVDGGVPDAGPPPACHRAASDRRHAETPAARTST